MVRSAMSRAKLLGPGEGPCLFAAFKTSSAKSSPLGPDPCMQESSPPFPAARRRAWGETRLALSGVEALEGSATGGAETADAVGARLPDSTRLSSIGADSPGLTIQA